MALKAEQPICYIVILYISISIYLYTVYICYYTGMSATKETKYVLSVSISNTPVFNSVISLKERYIKILLSLPCTFLTTDTTSLLCHPHLTSSIIIFPFPPSPLSPNLQPKIVEENLTYAELDLVRPIPEPKASRSGTVYAQILFGEQQL